MNLKKYTYFLMPWLVGLGIHCIDCPDMLNPQAWSLFAIFVGTIVGLIVKPLPMGAVALIGLLMAALTKTITMTQCLSGYGYSVIWLIIFVFFVARGFIKTKLGLRLGYFFISILGRRTLGLGYGLMLTEFLIAPLVPSSAARAGGIVYPLLHSICDTLDSKPENKTEKKLGAYLALVAVQGNHITSAMFLTSMAANPMIQAAAVAFGVDITWGLWFKAAIVPGLLSMVMVPLILYWVYPPQMKILPEAKAIAKKSLKGMGKMGVQEYIMGGTFLVMLVLWIMAKDWGIQTETTALLGVSILLLTGILKFEDILAEKEAWHTMLWLAVLVVMAENLQKLGFIAWFSSNIEQCIVFDHWGMSLGVIAVIYFYSHYFFASNTAHVSAMYAAFAGAAIALGAPAVLTILILAFCSSLYACLTHYGSAAAAVIYGANYVPIGTWWGLGFLMSVVYCLIWGGIGTIWWKVLGIF